MADLCLTGVDVPTCRSGLVRSIQDILFFHCSICAKSEMGFNYADKCFSFLIGSFDFVTCAAEFPGCQCHYDHLSASVDISINKV